MEPHPWKYHISESATKLLIGTFPTEARKRKYDFFYCSTTNRFWEVMSGIAKMPLNATEEQAAILERKDVLNALRLGVTDMGNTVYRQQGSSNDHSLFPVEFMDITSIISDHPKIDTVIVSGSKQGNSSLQWFSVFCDLNDIPFSSKKLDRENNVLINIGSRQITIVKGLSTSRQSRIKTEELTQHYNNILK